MSLIDREQERALLAVSVAENSQILWQTMICVICCCYIFCIHWNFLHLTEQICLCVAFIIVI